MSILSDYPCCVYSNNDEATLEIPALGQHFSLGDFYDIRKNRAVLSGIRFWNDTELEMNEYVQMAPRVSTMIFAGDNLDDWHFFLDISASVDIPIPAAGPAVVRRVFAT